MSLLMLLLLLSLSSLLVVVCVPWNGFACGKENESRLFFLKVVLLKSWFVQRIDRKNPKEKLSFLGVVEKVVFFFK
jgi:hypothetical protein